MKKAAGFITLHRQIVDWEWYKHPHTAFLFIHLLLSANFVDGTFKGMTIKRGQLVTSIPHLSTDTGLSIQQTKTALAHLRLTGEITDVANRQYRIITIVKYDDFQKLTDKSSNDQPTTNRQNLQRLTDERSNDQPQYNNIINKQINKETINKEREKKFSPPTKDEIRAFCQEEGFSIDVDYLFDYYSSKGWKVGSSSMKDWRAAVRNWARREKKDAQPTKTVVAQSYSQRDYGGEQEDAFKRMLEVTRA